MENKSTESFFTYNKIECAEGLSRRGRLVVGLVREFNNNSLIKNHRENDRGNSDFDRKPNYPEHLYTERIELKHFPMELLRWKDTESKRVILMLHGGGYIGMYKSYYRTMAGLYSEVSGGAAVLSIDYRVAPDNPFPAALEDACEAYNWLRINGYDTDDIVVAGDSAGGGLALALCLYLKDKKEKLPRGLVLMSPWTDLAMTGASYREHADTDPVFGNGNSGVMENNPYIGENDPKNPLISPLYGELEGLPPMLIQVGSDEMLYDDSASLYEKAKAAGVRVRFSEYENMFHVFQAAATIMPESKKAWAEVGRFMEAI